MSDTELCDVSVSGLLRTQREYYEAKLSKSEALLAKAVTSLQHIAANKTTGELTVIEWDTYDMFTMLDTCISKARTTLAELTGGKDG